MSCFILLSVLVSSINFIYGQESIICDNDSQASISVNVGTVIISSDQSFNSQMSETIIAPVGRLISFTESNDRQIFSVLDDQKKIEESSLNKDSNRKILRKAVKSVDKKIAETKIVSKKSADKIHRSNSDYAFHVKNCSLILAVAASNHHDSIKIWICNESILRQANDYLNSFQNFSFNNKSFDYCFNKIFSGRSPPVLA